MKKIVLVLAGVLVGAVAFNTRAQEAVEGLLLGVRYSHSDIETYEMPVGVTHVGALKRPVKLEDLREQLNYPELYGQLIQITGSGDRAVLWFQNPDGAIRNMVVDGASGRLVRLERFPDQKFKTELIRGR